MLCAKAQKISKLSEKDKFIFASYRVEALNQAGSLKPAITALKETQMTLKPDSQFECIFGYSSPWVDRNIKYSSKSIHQFNSTALALQDDAEINSKETGENLKKLVEQSNPELQSQSSPLSGLIVYNFLRKGQNSQVLHYLKRRKAPDQLASGLKPTSSS